MTMDYLGRLAPYFDLCCFLFSTPVVSKTPRTIWYRTPGKSFTLPPRRTTTECSCKVCPSPGMYAVTSIPFVNRTRATFRKAEFGFLGVIVFTERQTPLLNGEGEKVGLFFKTLKLRLKATALDLYPIFFRPFFISWLIVGTITTMLSHKKIGVNDAYLKLIYILRPNLSVQISLEKHLRWLLSQLFRRELQKVISRLDRPCSFPKLFAGNARRALESLQ